MCKSKYECVSDSTVEEGHLAACQRERKANCLSGKQHAQQACVEGLFKND